MKCKFGYLRIDGQLRQRFRSRGQVGQGRIEVDLSLKQIQAHPEFPGLFDNFLQSLQESCIVAHVSPSLSSTPPECKFRSRLAERTAYVIRRSPG